MTPEFKVTPVCEVCQKEEATSFSCTAIKNKKMAGWKFCGACTSDTEIYYVELARFFDSPKSTVDWIAHLSEKADMDWEDFFEMMRRFREATQSYNAL